MTRLLTAAVALPILIASIIFPQLHLVFVALAVTATVLGLYEFWFLARKRGARPDLVVGYAGAAALLAAFYFNTLDILLLIVPALVIASLAAEMLRGAPFEKMIISSGSTVLGVLYIALLGGHLVAVRTGWPDQPKLSTYLLSFFFLVLMGSDTGAYYVGRAFGRHKLALGISPGKTWEGAAGGMAASLLMAVLAHYWFFTCKSYWFFIYFERGSRECHELPLVVILPLAALMNLLGVVGDLTESALKRGAGAKDAANILPGHGGFLDRLDSLLFNAPLIYYFARLYFS